MALVVGIVKGGGWLCGYDCRCQVAVSGGGNYGIGEVMEDLGEGGDGGLGVEGGDVEGGTGQPGELFFGVYAGVFGDARYGGGAVECPVKVAEPFFEADGVERVEVSQWVHASCFLFHSVGYHLLYACVDAFE